MRFQICRKEDLTKRSRRNKPKTSQFEAELLAWVDAPSLHPSANGNSTRPIFAAFAGGVAELTPVIANLRLGHPGQIVRDYSSYKGDAFEFQKSVPYMYHNVPLPQGARMTLVYLPSALSPEGDGMVDPKHLAFCMMPTLQWVAAQPTAPQELCPLYQKAQWLGAMANLLRVFLDRRCAYPIPTDHNFLLRLLLAAEERGMCTWKSAPHSYYGTRTLQSEGLRSINLAEPLLWSSSQDQLATLLKEMVQSWRA